MRRVAGGRSRREGGLRNQHEKRKEGRGKRKEGREGKGREGRGEERRKKGDKKKVQKRSEEGQGPVCQCESAWLWLLAPRDCVLLFCLQAIVQGET